MACLDAVSFYAVWLRIDAGRLYAIGFDAVRFDEVRFDAVCSETCVKV